MATFLSNLLGITHTKRLRAAHEPEEEAMGKVYLSLSMSLDGFITGHNPRPEDRRRRLALYVLCLGC